MQTQETSSLRLGFGVTTRNGDPKRNEGKVFCEPTCDHVEIQRWAYLHGGHPAERLPEILDGEQPVLMFTFNRSQAGDERIIPISWEDFFARFDLLGLSFIAEEGNSLSTEYKIMVDPANGIELRPSA